MSEDDRDLPDTNAVSVEIGPVAARGVARRSSSPGGLRPAGVALDEDATGAIDVFEVGGGSA